MAITYKDAGVDVEAGYQAVKLMKAHAETTFNSNVLTGLGSFGGMYAHGDEVLISGTDGVGTKLKCAFVMDKHDTVGIDCVAMCANDVVCHGATADVFSRLHRDGQAGARRWRRTSSRAWPTAAGRPGAR